MNPHLRVARRGFIALRAVIAVALLLVGVAPWAGCRRSRGSEGSAPSASASASAKPAPRCVAVAEGAAFRIGEAGSSAADGEDRDLPFSTEVGAARGYSGGFAVGALAADKQGTQAVIALVGMDGASGRVIQLGPTYGSVAPPRIVAHEAQLFVVAPGSDAAGSTLRLGVIRDPRGDVDVAWGAELSEGWDESQAFDTLVTKRQGLVAWDQWTRAKDRSVVVVSTFNPRDVSRASEPKLVSASQQDAEGPRLVPRPGGSWLVYLERSPEETREGSPTRALDEGTGTVVELGRRTLVAVPLDHQGEPVSAPRRVNPKHSHVIVYDVAPSLDGKLQLVWRNDAASPGVERGQLHLAQLALDGTIKRHVIQGDSVGAGAPSLVPDHAEKPAMDIIWLTVGGATDQTQLVAIDAQGQPVGDLRAEPAVGRGEVLARYKERFLVGVPRGRSVEVSVLRCSATK